MTRWQLRVPGSQRIGHIVLAIFLCSFLLQASARAQDETPGIDELKKGQYDVALKLLSARLAASPTDAAAEKLLLVALNETGRYAEAETAAKKFLLKSPDAGGVRHQLAEIYAATGRYTEAIEEFARAASDQEKAKVPRGEKLESDLRRADLLVIVGQQAAAQPIFESFVKHYTDNDPQTALELTLVARALVHLEKFQDANDAYRAAIDSDSTHLDAQLGAAELFTDKYNYGDASQFLDDALQVNPNSARAHLDVAINKKLDGGEEMSAALERALTINPNYVAAMAFKAGLALEAGEFTEANAQLDKALKINPRSLEVHSLRAAMFYLQDRDRDLETEIAATLAINPRYGEAYNILSHFATITRRVSQSAEFARKATQISPRLWDAHLNLGMALLRLGQMQPGRAEIELAFKGDPFNVWAKNTLDLLDVMQDFKETRHAGFLIKTSVQESNVLPGYAGKLLDEAAAKLTAKYHFTPQGPITVEIFPNHEDFAVRTIGIPGLGALGVCFGTVIVQDSPSARETGEFNWGSTLWHEYTHVITLQMTDYRIPRWFSEGLSVYEERRARPGWGDDWNPLFVRSFGEGRWFKIADLDAGFQRPRRLQDLPIAYFQASQVCEFIADRFGFDAILKMLALYRDKAKTPDILRQVLNLSESDFDHAFSAYVESKARPLQTALRSQANFVASLTKEEVLKLLATEDTYGLHLRAAHLLQADGDTQGAITHYKRAIELFPYDTGDGNAYEALATLLEQKGDKAQAAEVLEQLIAKDENDPKPLKSLIRLRLEQKDYRRALEALRSSFYVGPFDYAAHSKAGELSLDANDYAGALEEFQVALALQPPNVAEANYNLASAYFLLGRQPEAKKSVLRALEAAPRYEKAQELLLRIVGQ